MTVELTAFYMTTEHTARLAGMLPKTLNNYRARHGLLKKQGIVAGSEPTPRGFIFREILTAAVAKRLIDTGLRPEVACKAANQSQPFFNYFAGTDVQIWLRDGEPMPVLNPDRDITVLVPILEIGDAIIREISYLAGFSVGREEAELALEEFHKAVNEQRGEG